jgi:hypothetical protein
MATHDTIIFFNAAKGETENAWRSASQFTHDCSFWIRSHIGAVNDDHTYEEAEQIVTSQLITQKRVMKLRNPLKMRISYKRSRSFQPFRMKLGAKTPMRKRDVVEDMNLFSGIYSRCTTVPVYTSLFNILLNEPDLLSKVPLDAAGGLRTTYSLRITEMLKLNKPLLTARWIENLETKWIFENTLARFVNHAVLVSSFRNMYGTKLVVTPDKPMLNGLKGLCSILPNSRTRTA